MVCKRMVAANIEKWENSRYICQGADRVCDWREIRRVFLFVCLKGKDDGMIPATLMDLIWVEQVWRENHQLWVSM